MELFVLQNVSEKLAVCEIKVFHFFCWLRKQEASDTKGEKQGGAKRDDTK